MLACFYNRFDIRLSFEMNDSGNTGYVSIEDFRDAVRQLGLPMTESQSASLAMKFAHGSNHDRVNYNEFLSFMNRSVPFLDLSSSMIDRTRVENSFVDRASFDLGDAFGGGFYPLSGGGIKVSKPIPHGG